MKPGLDLVCHVPGKCPTCSAMAPTHTHPSPVYYLLPPFTEAEIAGTQDQAKATVSGLPDQLQKQIKAWN